MFYADRIFMNSRETLEKSFIDPNILYYWGYMYDLSRNYMIDYLERKGATIKGGTIIEIGSAEGGNLCAMAKHGATELVGADIAEIRLERARNIAGILELDIYYTSNDIIYEEQPEEWQGHFDLALLRDVIEHLDDAEIALRNIKRLLKPGGMLYVTFPPWYSPFGGHQQLLLTKASRVPYVHFLPKPFFEKAIASGRANDVVEVRRLREIRMTTTKFRRASKAAGYNIVDERLFFYSAGLPLKIWTPTDRGEYPETPPGSSRFPCIGSRPHSVQKEDGVTDEVTISYLI